MYVSYVFFLDVQKESSETEGPGEKERNVCFSWWSLIHFNATTELKPEAISSMESPGRRPKRRHFQQDGHESQAAMEKGLKW